MNFSSAIGLVNNAALLLALGAIYDLSGPRQRRGRVGAQQVLTGAALGVIGIAVMLTRWELVPGLVFDTRSVLLSISGLFFGVVPTAVAVVMTAALRLYQGGVGAGVGVSVIVISGAIGLSWRHLRHREPTDMSLCELYVLGLVVHIAMLLCMLFLPWPMPKETLSAISIPVMLICPVATALLGRLLVNREMRRRVGEELRESEYKYRTLYENMAQGVFWQRADGVMLDANSSALEIFGLSRDEFLGRSSRPPEWLVIRTDGSNLPENEYPSIVALETGLPVRDYTVGIRDPRRAGNVWVTINAIPQFRQHEYKPYQVFVTLHDITERKKAEDALRLSEARFRSLVNQASDMMFLHDLAGDLVDVNQSALQQYGYSRQELLAMNVSDIDPDSTDRQDRSTIWESANLKHPVYLESRHRRKDGSSFPVELSISRIIFEDRVNILALARDITERKRAEDELRQYREHLEELVQERTIELGEANQELESFAYSVSHDLRAPLRAMDGFSSILLEDHAQELTTEAQHYLQLVCDNADQMGHLINDLLAFSRLGRQAIRKQEVTPGDLVTDVLVDLRDEQEGRHVEIIVGSLPPCTADPRLLRQVWVNLLSNALKYTRLRDVARVAVGCSEQSGEKVYFVRDNGIGFDMRYADKLFGVFQRLHRIEDYEGTGVGLAIVQRIIHRHGGRVWAEARVNEGATFYFTV